MVLFRRWAIGLVAPLPATLCRTIVMLTETSSELAATTLQQEQTASHQGQCSS